VIANGIASDLVKVHLGAHEKKPEAHDHDCDDRCAHEGDGSLVLKLKLPIPIGCR
jgi:hypothetical protein